MNFNCLNNCKTTQRANNAPQFILNEEQQAKLDSYLTHIRNSGCIINPNNMYNYLSNAGIDPRNCIAKNAAEPVEEDVAEEVDNLVDDDVEEPVQQPVFPILYLNDKKQTLINRIEELNREATLKGNEPTKMMPNEGLEFLHHPETITLSKARYKELKAGEMLSIHDLAVLLRQVVFNMYSYDMNLAKFLETETYGTSYNGRMQVSTDYVLNAMNAALKNVPGKSSRIDMETLTYAVTHLKEFIKDNLHLDVNSIYDIGRYDYEYALKNINEYNCGLKYGDVRKRYRKDKVTQKELTEASADHRIRPALEMAKKLKKMKIVDFYQEWGKLSTKKKERLSSEYGVTKPEPTNLKELDALYNANLISRRTYFNKKKSLS